MNQKLINMLHRLPAQDKDIALFVQHLLTSLEKAEVEHRHITALNAAAGIKPDMTEEATFHEDIFLFKTLILNELEKTTQDFEHLGDKNWVKHYKDGVHFRPSSNNIL